MVNVTVKKMVLCKCKMCEAEFMRPEHQIKSGRGKTCSILCRNRYAYMVSHSKPTTKAVPVKRPYIREDRAFKTCWLWVKPWPEGTVVI